uniref:RING-type domain-containing protein n=1 Tax=Panagrellus redivivus TaxID=6233 RepID=A0A7E4VDC8_PANRE
MAKCCDGRTGERLCRARCLVPTIIVIVVLHVLLWKFLIYPRFIADQANPEDEKALYGPGFGGDDSNLAGGSGSYEGSASGEGGTVPPEDPGLGSDGGIRPDDVKEDEISGEHHQFVDESEFLDSEYEVPPQDPSEVEITTTTTTTTEAPAPPADERESWISPTENDGVILAETPGIDSDDPNHEHYKNHHKHRHHHKHNKTRYVVKGHLETVKLVTKPWNWPYLDLTTPTPVDIATNKPHVPEVNTAFGDRVNAEPEEITTVQPTAPPTTSPTTTTSTAAPTTPTTTTTVAPTTTTAHHHHHHHHGHQQQHHHHAHTTTTTVAPPSPPPAWPTPSISATHHKHESPAEVAERIRAEEARRKQLEAEANLSAEEKRRIESIYQQQQQALKHRKHEEARRRHHEAEQRRRQEEEARRHQQQQPQSQQTQTPEEAERRRQHEEELARRRKLEEDERKRRLEHEERLRAWKEDEARRRQGSSETKQVAPAPVAPVADPWAHLRHLQEQAVDSVTVSPVTRPPPVLSRPGSAESSVSGVIADPFEITPHEVEGSSGVWRGHVDHDPRKSASREHVPTHHQYHHHEDTKAREALRQAQLEREAHQRRLDEENRRREEHQKLLAEAEARRQSLSNEVPGTVTQSQHHHHAVEGIQPVHHTGHGHAATGHHSHHHAHAHRQMTASLIPDDDITNEIAASREKSSESRSKRDTAPTIVTALMDIGRGEWHRFTRPFDLYLDYLMDLLKLENNIIIYGDSVVVDFVKSQGDAVDQSRLHLVEIALSDLPYYRYRDEIKSIMDSEQATWNETWERAVQAHPEAINPDYNILVNSKPYLLYNATQISPFPSDKFIWLDAGYSHGQKNMIPHELWNPELTPGKITAIKITGEQDKVVNYHIDHVYRKQWTVMSGGVLAGEASIIDRFRRFFHKSFMDLLDSRKTDDDQTTLLMTVVNYNSLFHILTGGWFDAFKLLPSTA